MDFLRLFAEEASAPAPAPERLALAIAGMAHPRLDVAHYLHEIDLIAEAVGEGLFAVRAGKARAERFLHRINHDLGFRGDREDYYDPRNSYLNEVIDRRVGLPILLSVLCMAVGKRLAVEIDGMGLPGHFVVRYRDEAESWLLDPFHAKLVRPEEAGDYLGRILGQPAALGADALRPATPQAIALRILNNLRNSALSGGDHALAIRALGYMVVLVPGSPALWHERGLLLYHEGDWEGADRDLRRYFFLTGHLELAWQAVKGEDVSQLANTPEERRALNILQQVEQMRLHLN